MRSGIIGFVSGAVLAVFAFAVVQRILIFPVASEITYRFSTCVFDRAEFPQGDVDNGRIIRRCLFPVRITTTFYDALYHEVKQADKPGRYGAVVRIDIAGRKIDRFITLYRVPVEIFWEEKPIPISAQLPPEIGLDPAVLRNQRQEIGETIKSSFVDDGGNVSPGIAILLAGLSETPPDAPPAVQRTDVVARDADWWDGLRQRIGLTEKYRYLADLPDGYDANPGRRWPLILYLGSTDDRGSDLQRVRVGSLPGLIAKGKRLPAIVVSPQCPADESWDPHVLFRLLDEVCAQYRVDPDRVSITGASAGGDIAWIMALARPERFAAIVPICGDTDPADAARLKNMPVWAFHGLKDDIVPVNQTTGMVEAIRRAGGHAHMTIFPDAGHDAWDKAYATEALYAWLLAQKRGQPEVVTPGVPAP